MRRTPKRIVIAGASGLLGKALIHGLQEAGYSTVTLSRDARPVPGTNKSIVWDGKSVGDWASELEGVYGVINLAGAPISQIWTDEARKQILESRVNSTRAIGQAIETCEHPPRVWLNASAIGYFGDTGEEAKSEDDPPGSDFLSETCLAWEKAQTEFQTPQTAMIRTRIGVVLARDGGALPVWTKLTKAFLGGAVGDGRQWVSWVHIDDLVRAFVWLIDGEREGAWNIVAPHPVRNEQLMAAIRKQVGRPWSPPAPSFALGLVKPITKVEPYLALVSQRVVPGRLVSEGFAFEFSEIDTALENLLT